MRRNVGYMEPSADDEAFALAFGAKERWAFEEAYRRFGALLYSSAYQVLQNSQDAQDCVHDALTRIWRSPGSYSRTRGALRSFLTVCVRNEAVTRLRSTGRRARLAEQMAALPIEHAELEIHDVIEHQRLRNALDALPTDQRLPLEMAYFEQKTQTEIARELEQPLGTIKSRIAIGLRKLGTALGGSQ